MLRVPADHCDEGEGKEDEEEDDFAAGEPEFGFAVDFDREGVEETR
jgi:hypothetical protein